MAADGTVFAADNQKIVRISPGNSYTFTALLTEAMPISPIFIETETITQQLFVATKHITDQVWAPIYLYDVVSLTLLSDLNLTVEGDRFETRNTPGAYGNRFYVSASGITDQTEGRLFAVDVFTDTTMQVAWGDEDYGESETSFVATPLTLTTLYTFTSPSGASPLVLSPVPPTYPHPIILFDGGLEVGGNVIPHIIAVEDDPNGPEILWTRPMSGVMAASYALDLRDIGTGKDSLWTFTKKKPNDGTTHADHRFLYRFGIANGTMINDPLDLNALVISPGEQGTYVPASAISIAGDENNPTLIISAVKFAFGKPVSTYLVAINLEISNLLWKIPMPYTNGQYPIIVDSVNGELIFATTHGYEEGGIRVIGEEQ